MLFLHNNAFSASMYHHVFGNDQVGDVFLWCAGSACVRRVMWVACSTFVGLHPGVACGSIGALRLRAISRADVFVLSNMIPMQEGCYETTDCA